MATHMHAKPAGTPTWLDLTTTDLDAARAFYQAVFGWEYDIGGPEFGFYTTARLGQHSVAGLGGQPADSPPMPVAWGLYFASHAIEADLERAVELGARVLFPPLQVAHFGSMAVCEDPTGAAFSFWLADQNVGAQITDEPGAMTWFELYSPDAKRARDFYTELLGASADAMPGDLEYYVLKHGEQMLAGIMQIDPSWGEMPAHWVAYFMVTNASETAATITAHGGTQMGGIDDTPFGRFAAFRDPAGAVFKILEPPAS